MKIFLVFLVVVVTTTLLSLFYRRVFQMLSKELLILCAKVSAAQGDVDIVKSDVAEVLKLHISSYIAGAIFNALFVIAAVVVTLIIVL